LEIRSLAVGYLFLFPHSRQVINTVVPGSDLILTRQFTPGTSKDPHRLQSCNFCSLVNRTPAFIPISRASSTYRFARPLSDRNASRAWLSKMAMRSRAISLVPPALLQANCLTYIPPEAWSCNLFCGAGNSGASAP
jgi:hypothetical protein